jgi:ABC-type transporter Mla MlaB component
MGVTLNLVPIEKSNFLPLWQMAKSWQRRKKIICMGKDIISRLDIVETYVKKYAAISFIAAYS